MNRKYFNTKTLVLMALFAALLCISAYISIALPIPGAPKLTIVNFMVILITFIFPAAQPVIIVTVWLLLGIAGIPVFIGGMSGIAYLVSPWGGYTVSFLLVAVIFPFIKGRYNRIKYTFLCIAAAIVIDIAGMLWLAFIGGNSVKFAFLYGFVPFIAADIVKAVAAAQIVPLFTKILNSDYSA